MLHQLAMLRAELPVLLDPVARRAAVPRAPERRELLPQHPQSRVLLTFGGTAALYQAASALGLGAGDEVLLPAYNCGHEVEPFLRAGATGRFYRVDASLAIDMDDLERNIGPATRAVLVTHYFGFPQPVAALRSLCDRHGIALIEDCAHALFSRDGETPLGLVGAMAVYSMRKTLPLPHGGALVVHDARRRVPERLPDPPMLSTLAKTLERRQKALLLPEGRAPTLADRAAFIAARSFVDALRGLRATAHLVGVTQVDPDGESLAFPGAALAWGAAAAVGPAVARAPAESIVAVRRRNFEALAAVAPSFRDCAPLLTALPDGVCPLYFPVRAPTPGPLLALLRARGISAIQWWSTLHRAVPWTRFAEALELKTRVLALPIHQDLRPEHMRAIIAVLRAEKRVRG